MCTKNKVSYSGYHIVEYRVEEDVGEKCGHETVLEKLLGVHPNLLSFTWFSMCIGGFEAIPLGILVLQP